MEHPYLFLHWVKINKFEEDLPALVSICDGNLRTLAESIEKYVYQRICYYMQYSNQLFAIGSTSTLQFHCSARLR